MKPPKIWLILDMSNMAWRAFYTFKGLTARMDKENATGVVFGILRDIRALMDTHATTRIAFCFDEGESLRKKIYPEYKKERHSKELTEQEKKEFIRFKNQLQLLKTTHLKRLGFKNVFFAEGFEGDDVVASVVSNLDKNDEGIIVSTDKDFYQLLQKDKVFIWNPVQKQMLTSESVKEESGIEAKEWIQVKALSGCKSDGIKGIPGIGEKTAIKYVKGEIPAGSRVGLMISENYSTFQRNIRLVRLPLHDKETKIKTPKFICQEDQMSLKEWRDLTAELGMTSISDRPPKQTNGFGLKVKRLKNGE